MEKEMLKDFCIYISKIYPVTRYHISPQHPYVVLYNDNRKLIIHNDIIKYVDNGYIVDLCINQFEKMKNNETFILDKIKFICSNSKSNGGYKRRYL